MTLCEVYVKCSGVAPDLLQKTSIGCMVSAMEWCMGSSLEWFQCILNKKGSGNQVCVHI